MNTETATIAPLSRRISQAATRAFRGICNSRLNYYLSYATDLACAAVFATVGWQALTHWSVVIACFVAGAFLFSFCEYAIHRWLFHSPLSFMTPIHHEHHETPHSPSALPFFSSPGVSLVVWLALAPVFGAQGLAFFSCGFLLAYFCYGALHHCQHAIRLKALPFRWLRERWAAHAIHHGRRSANFGVTSPLWDYVFGTHYRRSG